MNLPTKSTNDQQQSNAKGHHSDTNENGDERSNTPLSTEINDALVMRVAQRVRAEANKHQKCSICGYGFVTHASLQRYIESYKNGWKDRPDMDIIQPNGMVKCRMCGQIRPRD